MSDRADFLAGIAASGDGSPFGIHGDFGTFGGPYPDPSPPSGVYDIFDHDMSDAHRSSGGEDHSDEDDSTSEAPETDKPSISATKKQKKLDALAKKQLEIKKAQEQKLKRQMFHLHLDKSPRTAFASLSGDARRNLARISREARAEFGNSKMKKLKHLRWAFQTFTPAGYANYVHLIGVDKEMHRRLSHPELDGEPFEHDSIKRNPKHRQDRAVKAARKREKFAAQARPSRKKAPTVQLMASAARKKKFNEMVKLCRGKTHKDQATQKRFHAWARKQLGKKWVPKFNKIFGPA